MSALLVVRDLTVRYGKRTILNRVSLSAGRAERIAILGASGSGKTSFLRALNGFTPVASGRIEIDGVDVTAARGHKLRAVRRHIGFVSQRHDLIDPLSVHHNVIAGALGEWSLPRAFRALIWPAKAELETSRTALAQVGLADKLRVRTATLSGGEHQRVAIARALVQNPILLLADEPVASLDPAASRQILELLTGLAAVKQVALVCTLHQPELAEQYFDRIVHMEGGCLREEVSTPLGAGI